MAFTENLLYSTLLLLLSTHITVAYGGCSYRPDLLYQTPKITLIISTNALSVTYSTWPAPLHSTDRNLNFFSESICHVHMNYIRASHTRRDWTTKSSNVCNFCLFTTGPQNPVIPVWFLFCSWWCYEVTCTMSNVGCLPTTEEQKEKYSTSWSMFGQGK